MSEKLVAEYSELVAVATATASIGDSSADASTDIQTTYQRPQTPQLKAARACNWPDIGSVRLGAMCAEPARPRRGRLAPTTQRWRYVVPIQVTTPLMDNAESDVDDEVAKTVPWSPWFWLVVVVVTVPAT